MFEAADHLREEFAELEATLADPRCTPTWPGRAGSGAATPS